MAKVKKMAFGGMGSRPPMGGMRPGMGPSRGALGGNQAPAGNNLLREYAQNTLRPGSGLQSLDPNIAKAMQAYQAQPGQPTSPPPFKSSFGFTPGMKKGGKVKAYAKGGSVKSSASSRGDGIAQRGKTKGRVV